MSNERWISQEEIDELQKARPSSGNDFLDAYWLGYDAGKAIASAEIEKIEKEKSDNYWKAYRAEKERDELKAENERLAAKVKKLKKRVKESR